MMLTVLKYLGYLLLLVLVTAITLSLLNLTKIRYNRLVDQGLSRNQTSSIELLKEEDILNLPLPVQQYLKYVGVIDSPKVYSYTVDFTGLFKMDEDKDFAPMTANQTSYQKDLTRLFYMKLKYKGFKVAGLHHLVDGQAVMEIKLLDLIKVVDERGDAMNQAEMVTMLNDMALFAPATLIDERITWETLDDNHVVATFTNRSYSVQATLVFNEEGQLINFISDDRYATINGQSETVRWTTPITEYKKINGFMLPHKGSAIWNYEDRQFEYIKLNIIQIEYNKGME